MNATSIEWTTFSANPIKYRRKSDGKTVWACVKVSPGCANCYAEALALRFDRGKLFNATNMEEVEPFLDEKELAKIMTAKTIAGISVDGSKVFLGDMTDVFGPWVPFAFLDRIFAAMSYRPDTIFQILTKRPEIMQRYMNQSDVHLRVTRRHNNFQDYNEPVGPWPPENVWLGTSVENQEQADERMPHLLATKAAVRFLSCEPLLGPINLERLSDGRNGWTDCLSGVWGHGFSSDHEGDGTEDIPDGITGDGIIDWVIVGGESGPKARPCNAEWVRDIIAQCKASGTSCFIKQLGSEPRPSAMPSDVVVRFIKESHGRDPLEWPQDLQVRQFPTTRKIK